MSNNQAFAEHWHWQVQVRARNLQWLHDKMNGVGVVGREEGMPGPWPLHLLTK